MVDLIVLRIDGVNWLGWKSVSITRQMDAIAGAFTLSLADRWSHDAKAMPLAAGMPCEILIGNDSVIKGYIDKVSPSFSENDHAITVTGRDASADLVDCSAVQRPGHWINQSALQLCTILAKPFGVSVRAEGYIGAPIASFKLEQGETAFEAMDCILKMRELLACPDGSGGLILLKTGARTNSVALVQGQNIKNSSMDFDLTDRHSAYLVQGQQQGTDEVYGEAVAAVNAETADPSIKRYRPLIVRAESSVDSASARQRAAWECSVRAARSVTVNVTVQGFRQSPEGDLWQHNAITEVDIPFYGLKQQLVASKVTFSLDDKSGSLTTIELKDPKAFQPEPKKKLSADSGTASTGPIEKERDLQAEYAARAGEAHQEIKEGA